MKRGACLPPPSRRADEKRTRREIDSEGFPDNPGGIEEGAAGSQGDTRCSQTAIREERASGLAWTGVDERRPQGMISVDEEARKEGGKGFAGDGGMTLREDLCNQRLRPIVRRPGATIRAHGTVSAFSRAAGAMRNSEPR